MEIAFKPLILLRLEKNVAKLGLLDCFSFEETELGVMDLSNMLDMPKATVSRLRINGL